MTNPLPGPDPSGRRDDDHASSPSPSPSPDAELTGTAGTAGRAFRYDYAIEPDGDTTANKVLRFVGSDRRVLELGCGPGAMTRYMRDRLNCRVTAVEFDPAQAEQARPYCEELLIADLDRLDFAGSFGDRRFDVIVAADVLEHLRDPWRCLREVRALLDSDGCLVVSVPNVAHNVIIAQLLAGRFPYQDQGLLDRTHLRFFARRDVEDLLLGSGYVPALWERSTTAENDTEFGHIWTRMPEKIKALLAESSEGQTYQYVVKAYRNDEAGRIASARADREALLAENHQLQQDLNGARRRLEEYVEAFHEARDLLGERDAELNAEREAARQAQHELTERQLRLNESDRELQQMRLRCDGQLDRLAQLQREVERMQRSPLERLGNWLRRISQR